MQEKTDILTALSSKVEAAAIQGSAIKRVQFKKSKAPAGHKQTSQQCSNQHKRLSTKKKQQETKQGNQLNRIPLLLHRHTVSDWLSGPKARLRSRQQDVVITGNKVCMPDLMTTENKPGQIRITRKKFMKTRA